MLACALGLTMTVSAQTMNPRDHGNFNPAWTGGIVAPTADYSAVSSKSPNPFSNAAVIDYTLATPGHVRLNIYDSEGSLIETLVDAYRDAGNYSVVWNASDRESGTFLCTLNCGDSLRTLELTVLK